MTIRFYPDPDSGLPHLFGHGVNEAEAAEVLQGPGDDIAGTNGSRLKLGQTFAGRYLKVVHVPDDDPDSVFVITAYELRGEAKQAFRRRWRRRRR